MTRLSIFSDWKNDIYNTILIIINQPIAIIYYKLVKVIINVQGLADITIKMVVYYNNILYFIMNDYGLVLISKLLLLLYYFFGIKLRILNIFYPRTNSQIKKQNITIEAYLYIFINIDYDNCANLLPMAKFTYNNKINTSTGQIFFELNCRCYSISPIKKKMIIVLN